MNLAEKIVNELNKFIGERLTDDLIIAVNQSIRAMIENEFEKYKSFSSDEVPIIYVVRHRDIVGDIRVTYGNLAGAVLMEWVYSISSRKR